HGLTRARTAYGPPLRRRGESGARVRCYARYEAESLGGDCNGRCCQEHQERAADHVILTSVQLPETVSDRPKRERRARWPGDLLFFTIAVSIIAADQFAKWLVRSNLELGEQWPAHEIAYTRIVHVVNSGAAFGILQG